MGGAAFNDSKLPLGRTLEGLDHELVRRAVGTTSGMWTAFLNTICVALAVVALSVPIGTAAAILINSVWRAGRGRCSTG